MRGVSEILVAASILVFVRIKSPKIYASAVVNSRACVILCMRFKILLRGDQEFRRP
jgi:hypothetical protein